MLRYLRYALLTVALVTAHYPTLAAAPSQRAVVEHYANLAHAIYSDALTTAEQLQQAIDTLIKEPSSATQLAAQQAWRTARVPYSQSEVFRFGNSVDDEWALQVNAWPIDESFIDYVTVASTNNANPAVNIIANTEVMNGAQRIDVSTITPVLLTRLNQLGGVAEYIATGYHAIEFLLWGQDINKTGSGAGDRPYTDYVIGKGCTNGHCERRAQYLQAATELLVNDLRGIVRQWAPGQDNYRAELLKEGGERGLGRIIYGMSNLSLSELAGERMQAALVENSPEDEQDQQFPLFIKSPS